MESFFGGGGSGNLVHPCRQGQGANVQFHVGPTARGDSH